MVLTGRHLGAKLKSKLNMDRQVKPKQAKDQLKVKMQHPNMGPQANHKQMQHLQGKCTQQVKMKPKQANHQLKLNMQLKIILLEILLPMNIYLQVNHPSATIGQLQIVGLTGRHLGAKLKSKLNMDQQVKPKLNNLQPNMLVLNFNLQLNLQPNMQLDQM